MRVSVLGGLENALVKDVCVCVCTPMCLSVSPRGVRVEDDVLFYFEVILIYVIQIDGRKMSEG